MMDSYTKASKVRVITNEKEIEHNYLTTVALVPGFINIDMDDFYQFANQYKLAMEIIVDSPAQLYIQVKTAMDEIRRHGIEHVAAIILSISYKSSSTLLMKELNWDNDLFDFSEIEFKIGVRENKNISNNRSISLFAFV